MSDLLEHRKRLGMTQAHVALLFGTKQPNISAYEAGSLDPGEIVGERISGLCQLPVQTAHQGGWLGTMASHAVALRELLLTLPSGDAARDLLIMRYVIGMNDAFTQAPMPADQAFFLTPPGSTGANDVDSLLAGMAVHWCRMTNAKRTPSWTHAPQLFLAKPWWIGLDSLTPRLTFDAFTNGVPSLRARGIFLDRKTLASV